MITRAFKLRDNVDSKLFGGSITRPDGTAFDIAAALEDGGGVIVTNDENIANSLSVYEPLKSVAVPEGAEIVEGDTAGDIGSGFDEDETRSDLNAEKKDELVRRANSLDPPLELPAGVTKDQIVDALVARYKEGQ